MLDLKEASAKILAVIAGTLPCEPACLVGPSTLFRLCTTSNTHIWS